MALPEGESALGVRLNTYGGDPILNINADYVADPRTQKVNASIGLMFEEGGAVFVPPAIRVAFDRLHTQSLNTVYATPEDRDREWTGVRSFIEGTARVAFERFAPELLAENRIAAAGTAGGTMGLNVVAEAIKLTKLNQYAVPDVLLGAPPYPNHPTILNFRGLPVRYFEQMNADGAFDMNATIDALEKVRSGSVFFLQLEAHNPTGINAQDPTEWREIARQSRKKNVTAVFDVPYAGFYKGIDEDTEPIRVFMEEGVQVVVIMSFSKTAGLYGERTACILVPEQTSQKALEDSRLFSGIIRIVASSPPRRGEDVMSIVYLDPELMKLWTGDEGLGKAASLLGSRRRMLASRLPDKIGSTIQNGAGMFSLLPIGQDGVEYLRKEHAVYTVSLGDQMRINIGGISTTQVPYFAEAVNDTLLRFPSHMT